MVKEFVLSILSKPRVPEANRLLITTLMERSDFAMVCRTRLWLRGTICLQLGLFKNKVVELLTLDLLRFKSTIF